MNVGRIPTGDRANCQLCKKDQDDLDIYGTWKGRDKPYLHTTTFRMIT